ncbi:hypothetical protein EVAR_68793_1 [Eumeta japonica]|uniref:Uncharacterized protein n=1 Tax=Eumeta variegata TaxID=151549 RepID=A0A4C1ZW79_EUMVA|nr:hypothetical protein EVAR_68793_1 [Eumeta japonica]
MHRLRSVPTAAGGARADVTECAASVPLEPHRTADRSARITVRTSASVHTLIRSTIMRLKQREKRLHREKRRQRNPNHDQPRRLNSPKDEGSV